MAQYDELTGLLRELLTNRFSPKPRYVRGVLGDGLGNVVVPDRPDKSYARFSKNSTTFFEIFNRTVNPVNNWPILIGELPWQPGLTQVVDTDWSAFEQAGWGDTLGNTSPHAPTHEWPDGAPGSDAVSVHPRAIVPGRAFLSDSTPTVVYVNSFEYGTTGTLWPGLPGVDLQPLMSATVTGTMRYAGVYVDESTNSLGVVTGSTTVYTSALEPPRVSFPAANVIPIARVRVYGGQAGLVEADIKDARRLWGSRGSSSTGGGWPFPNIITVSAAGDYTTLQDAVDACSGGEQIVVGIDTTEDVTVDVAVEIYGATKDIAITGHFILTAAAKIRNLTLAQAGTDTDNICLDFQTNNALVENCVIQAIGAGTNNYAAYMFGSYTGNELRNCDVTASGATNKYAVYLAGVAGTPNTFAITGSKINGTTDDIYLNKSDMTLYLRQGPVLVNNDLNAAFGSVNGNYNDINGNVRVAAGEDFFPGGDNAGVNQRRTLWTTISDDFTTFSGWTWASNLGFDGTPVSGANVSSYQSLLYLYDNSDADSFFAYVSLAASVLKARMYAAAGCYAGIRIDNGGAGAENSIELLIVDSTTSGLKRLRWDVVTAGTPAASVYYCDGIPPQFYVPQLAIGGGVVYGYFTADGPQPTWLGASQAIGWTVARAGIVLRHSLNSNEPVWIDWIYRA